MNLQDYVNRINAAGPDPKAQAVTILDIVLESQPPELRRVVEAAAVVRWFNAQILKRMLDPDLEAESDKWFGAVTALNAVEKFAAKNGYNVHENTRLGLRRRLYTENRKRFLEFTGRAAVAVEGSDNTSRIEHAYHCAILAPETFGEILRPLNFDLKADPQEGLALAGALDEYREWDGWNPHTRAWAFLTSVSNRDGYRPVDAQFADCKAAQSLFTAANDQTGLLLADRCLAFTLDEMGSMKEALQLSEKCVQASERISEEAGFSESALRDVAHSQEQLAVLLARRGEAGDLARALQLHQRSLEIRERLVLGNPLSRRDLRNISVSLNKIACLLESRAEAGDADLALQFFRRSMTIRERIAEANPHSAQALRDFSISLERLGTLLKGSGQEGDLEQTQQLYRRSLEIRERIAAANPQSAQALRDVSLSLERLGGLLRSRGRVGDPEEALEFFRRSLDIRERIAESNPQSSRALRDVSISLNKLGGLLQGPGHAGDIYQAQQFHLRSLKIRERIAAVNPQFAEALRDLLVVRSRLERNCRKRGDAESAASYGRLCLELLERFDREGRHMDNWMRSQYQRLKARFPEASPPTSPPTPPPNPPAPDAQSSPLEPGT